MWAPLFLILAHLVYGLAIHKLPNSKAFTLKWVSKLRICEILYTQKLSIRSIILAMKLFFRIGFLQFHSNLYSKWKLNFPPIITIMLLPVSFMLGWDLSDPVSVEIYDDLVFKL